MKKISINMKKKPSNSNRDLKNKNKKLNPQETNCQ